MYQLHFFFLDLDYVSKNKKINPDVRNICLVDVIALWTPCVVVSSDPEPARETGRQNF